MSSSATTDDVLAARGEMIDPDLGVNVAEVNWVFTPPGTPARITEDGRKQLRAIGFSL
jgi:metal-sulfur cluster biosynthetic enzyme